MKITLVMLLLTFISGCSTIAGAVKGVGEDVKHGTDAVSTWILPAAK